MFLPILSRFQRHDGVARHARLFRQLILGHQNAVKPARYALLATARSPFIEGSALEMAPAGSREWVNATLYFGY